ncbi:MAG TPA: hypothetical protein VNQ79_05730 [Blastocatellia bacterium]|nr:hypothetical protein [Blastocatellia bacterium]
MRGAFNGGNAPAASALVKEYGYRGGQLLMVFDSTQTGDDQLTKLVPDHSLFADSRRGRQCGRGQVSTTACLSGSETAWHLSERAVA